MTSNEEDIRRALLWITDVFARADVTYQAVGGIAARAFGATRPVADLDFYLDRTDLAAVLGDVREFCVWGPSHFRDETWDLTFAKVDWRGVRIELAQAEGAKYYSTAQRAWIDQGVDFGRSARVNVMGVELLVMPREQLIAYKQALGRPVDRADLEQIGQ
jgi:hypothetical protein